MATINIKHPPQNGGTTELIAWAEELVRTLQHALTHLDEKNMTAEFNCKIEKQNGGEQ